MLTRVLTFRNCDFITQNIFPLIYVIHSLQLLQVESELWLSELQKFIGNAIFLALSVALFNYTEMKRRIRSNCANLFQTYADYNGSPGFSGDGRTRANSGYHAVFLSCERPGYAANILAEVHQYA